MIAPDATTGWVSPKPRRKGRGVRLVRRFWWVWMLGVPAMALVMWDWSAGGDEERDRVERAMGGNPPPVLATAVAERRTWDWDGGDGPGSGEGAAAESMISLAGKVTLAPGTEVAVETAAPGVLRLSAAGNVEAWRFAPSMEAGDHSLGPVDRITWYREQSRYLQVAVDEVFALLKRGMYVEPAEWDEQWSGAVRDTAAAVRDVYAGGRETGWQLALQRWDCWEELDVDLHHGLSPGCPTAVEWRRLSQTWRQLGKVNEILWQMGVTGALYEPDGPWRSVRSEALLALTRRLERQVESFEVHRRDLLNSRDQYGHSVHVTMPEFWRAP